MVSPVPASNTATQHVLPMGMPRSNVEIAYADPKVLTGDTFARYYNLIVAPGNRKAALVRVRQSVLARPEPLLCRIEAAVPLL